MVKKYVYDAIKGGDYRKAIELLAREIDCTSITGPNSMIRLLAPFAKDKQEGFFVVTLDGAHVPIRLVQITKGLVNKTVVHPREVYAVALEDRAAAIIVAHNHPSGRLAPSPEDLDVTNTLKHAGEIMKIPLLDHLVFGWSMELMAKGINDGVGIYSMVENGDMMV